MKSRDLLNEMVKLAASDLHIKVGSPPGFRVHGELHPLEGHPPLDPETCQEIVGELLTPEQKLVFETEHDLDFSLSVPDVARFRVNVFYQKGTCAAAIRIIPIEIPSLEAMGLPPILKTLCDKPRGLILVTGPTGSGKSTTLAAMVDRVNQTKRGHILTLEDPIEFVHEDKQCYVNQREIGHDSKSFGKALRAALREDPDYMLVGEMRDLETIALAITAAETGHLVFGTLHTTSALQTVDRIIDVFPSDAQAQVRTQLATTIQGVISQILLPRTGGGRICAQEIMTGSDAVRSYIREGKTHQLVNALQTGSKFGMQTLDSQLERLSLGGQISPDDALRKASNPAALRLTLAEAGIVVHDEERSGGPESHAPRPLPQARPQSIPQTKPLPPPMDGFEKFRKSRGKFGK